MLAVRALLCVLLVVAWAGESRAADDDIPSLEEGVPFKVALKQGRSTWNGRFQVPEGARSLALVATGDGDLDLFVKRGRPVMEDFEAEADAFRRSESAAEVLVLGGEGPAAPAAGTWFVTLEHPRAAFRGVSGQVLVLVERADGPRTVLPGHPATVSVGQGASPTLRTCVPP